MAIRYAPKDHAQAAPAAPAEQVPVKTDGRETAAETPAAAAVGADLFGSGPKAAARKRKLK